MRSLGNPQAKAHANVRAQIPVPSARAVFLSQAGPRFVLELVQAEHHLCSSWVVALQNDKGDPVWVALDWLCYAASGLACMPPSEGLVDVDPPRPGDAARVRRFRRDKSCERSH